MRLPPCHMEGGKLEGAESDYLSLVCVPVNHFLHRCPFSGNAEGLAYQINSPAKEIYDSVEPIES